MKHVFTLLIVLGFAATAAVPGYRWIAVEIDKIEIGYGLQIADGDGDRKTDT